MPPVKTKVMAKPKNTKKTILRLIEYMGSYKGLLVLVFFAVIISAGAGVAGDSLLKPVINNYIIPLFNRVQNGETLSSADFFPFKIGFPKEKNAFSP